MLNQTRFPQLTPGYLREILATIETYQRNGVDNRKNCQALLKVLRGHFKVNLVVKLNVHTFALVAEVESIERFTREMLAKVTQDSQEVNPKVTAMTPSQYFTAVAELPQVGNWFCKSNWSDWYASLRKATEWKETLESSLGNRQALMANLKKLRLYLRIDFPLTLRTASLQSATNEVIYELNQVIRLSNEMIKAYPDVNQ